MTAKYGPSHSNLSKKWTPHVVRLVRLVETIVATATR